ncbi:hypothetical protein DFR65_11122 [Oceanihabitans sediminis]|nr:hypothetical protein DFR65_11122 [Oceanihabitans sediminis]
MLKGILPKYAVLGILKKIATGEVFHLEGGI